MDRERGVDGLCTNTSFAGSKEPSSCVHSLPSKEKFCLVETHCKIQTDGAGLRKSDPPDIVNNANKNPKNKNCFENPGNLGGIAALLAPYKKWSSLQGDYTFLSWRRFFPVGGPTATSIGCIT